MSTDEMLKVLNKKGSWKWTIRDSHWYGDYLICGPKEGVRVRIHHPAESFVPDRQHPKNYYTALLAIESEAAATLESIDQIFCKR